jgi:hypothetical protein
MEMRLRPSAIEIEYNNAIFLKKLHSKEEEDLFGKCPKVKNHNPFIFIFTRGRKKCDA